MFLELDEKLNSLAPNFLNDCMKCYKLIIVMRQNEPLFINIINKFRKETHNITNIHTMNDLCFKQPPNNSSIPNLCYMKNDTLAYDLKVFAIHKVLLIIKMQYILNINFYLQNSKFQTILVKHLDYAHL